MEPPMKPDEVRQLPLLTMNEDPLSDRQMDAYVEQIASRVHSVSATFLRAVERGQTRGAHLLLEQMYQLHDLQQQIVQLPATSRSTTWEHAPSPVPIYCAGSLFLDECYQYLLQGEPEWMHAVTGVKLGTWYTLDRMILMESAVQTTIRVTAKPDAVFGAMARLTQFGHALHGVFHSHRMQGVQRPSNVDLKLQERLKGGGYPAIQCIFSEDGYMSFFGDERPFTVRVVGKGVEQIDENIYRFVDRRAGGGDRIATASCTRSTRA